MVRGQAWACGRVVHSTCAHHACVGWWPVASLWPWEELTRTRLLSVVASVPVLLLCSHHHLLAGTVTAQGLPGPGAWGLWAPESSPRPVLPGGLRLLVHEAE